MLTEVGEGVDASGGGGRLTGSEEVSVLACNCQLSSTRCKLTEDGLLACEEVCGGVVGHVGCCLV